MKSAIFNPVFPLLALAGVAFADMPKKASLESYAGLVANSPFTSKPVQPPSPNDPNPLENYGLLGISPIGNDHYRVTLVQKTKPSDRIIVDSDKPNGDFKFLDISRKSADPLSTVVHMQLGLKTGTIGFDSKLIAIAPKVISPPTANTKPSIPPRPRVVPPTH